ncbi:MAG TPA: hypothetical protein VHF08_00535, partial [Nitrososphaeraceae archaeon]|nr:hypothetical protein [Nitrososphaeraceae archaeon]
VGGVCADTVIVGSVLVIIAVAPALNSSNINDIPTVKVYNEFLFMPIIIYLKIYKIYSFEYATNNPFIGKIRGFNK